MSISAIRKIALAATSLSSLLSVSALAQNAQGANEGNGTDIIVTARRIEEKLQDVPISITVFNQEQLTSRNITNSTELALYTPSLTVNSRFGPEKASFSIRGFSQELNTLPTVGVYFADVIAPRLSSNITSGNGAGVGMLFDLQNVQVLKGPQGTLFGRNTTGGAILVVPQKPTGRLEGYIEGTYGNYNQRRVQAVINVPLSDSLKIRAGIDWNKRDGYIKNHSGIGPDDFNDLDYISARLSVLAQLGASIENYTVATYVESNTNNTVGKGAFCNRTPGVGLGGTAITRSLICAQLDRQIARGDGLYDVENSHPNPFVKSRIWQVSNTTTWEVSDNLTIKNIASYADAKEAYAYNITGDNTPFPFVEVRPGLTKSQGHQYTWTEELQFQGTGLDNHLKWQAGGYLERSNPTEGYLGQEQYTSIFAKCSNVYAFQCDYFQLTIPVGGGNFFRTVVGTANIARNVYRYKNEGLYAQATYDLSDKFAITGGFRYTWDWQDARADNTVVRPIHSGLPGGGTLTYACTRALTPASPDARLTLGGFCTRTFVQKSSAPTWLINLDYKPNNDILVYAKYSRGYRGGGINESNIGAETWQPEKLDTYEVGFKTSFRGTVSGNFNIAGFWNEFKNQQATVAIPQCIAGQPGCTKPAPSGINGIQNVAASRIKGIEADASLTFFNSLRFDLGYAYLDARVTGTSAAVCDNTAYNCSLANFLSKVGATLPYTPKNTFTATATYTLPLDESVGVVSIGATFSHTDSQFVAGNNAPEFAAGRIPFDSGIIPSRNILNLNVNWKGVGGMPLDMAVFATNVTKEEAYVAGSAFGLGTIGGEFITLGQPRFYGVRLKYRFGN